MRDYPTRRDALPGELCTCGRQAREVILTTDHREVGYCGIPDGGDKTGPCPFCGGKRHESGACPQYQVGHQQQRGIGTTTHTSNPNSTGQTATKSVSEEAG